MLVVVLIGVVGLWVVVSLQYLSTLRRLASTRQETLAAELWRLNRRLYDWETALAAASAAEYRSMAAALTRLREVMDRDTALSPKLHVLGELRTLLERQQSLSSGADAPAPELEARARQVHGAMQRTEEALADYGVIAAEADFAAGHFPLSLMAAAVGIRAQWLTAQ